MEQVTPHIYGKTNTPFRKMGHVTNKWRHGVARKIAEDVKNNIREINELDKIKIIRPNKLNNFKL
jgi:phosphoribosylaminoimidazole carboxylase (NCAIR synthetase)